MILCLQKRLPSPATLSDIPIAHVEAGLRSGNILGPFPEEGCRRHISKLASLHFSPTTGARDNLIKEGVHEGDVFVVGNTVMDSLNYFKDKNKSINVKFSCNNNRIISTIHRYENIMHSEEILRALRIAVEGNSHIELLFVKHPTVRLPDNAIQQIRGHRRIRIIEPLAYPDFLATLAAADLVVTDSGGIQEECPALGVPVFIARNETERPEGISLGRAQLVGTSAEYIISAIYEHFGKRNSAEKRDVAFPYGQPGASKKIVRVIRSRASSRSFGDLLETGCFSDAF